MANGTLTLQPFPGSGFKEFRKIECPCYSRCWGERAEKVTLSIVKPHRSEKGRELCFNDIELAHAGTQGAAIQTEDFGCTVLAADFPTGLFKSPENVVFFNGFKSLLI